MNEIKKLMMNRQKETTKNVKLKRIKKTEMMKNARMNKTDLY